MKSEKTPDFDPNWQDAYSDCVVSAEEAIANVQPGHRVFIGTGCAEPQELVNALVSRASELVDIELLHLLTSGSAPYATKELARNFSVNSFFIAANVRDIIQQGLGHYTPIFLSDIPRLFTSGHLPLDVALIQVTPPDSRGMCSLGVSVDIVKSAAENARLVIAQVNPQMPRTHGDSSLHVFDIDYLVPADVPLIEFEVPESDDATRRIGEYVAALVDDGATIELGIGQIPQAVQEFLGDKHDLGIHTEMLVDSIVDLIEKGVITGANKSTDRGKIVVSFCMGTRKLYDYIHNNDIFAFHPTEYVNDPYIISQQHKMTAINVALEIDLTGQVCADSLGNKFYSGIGGQVDFNRGAARAINGKAIIAMPSTARDGTVSRIVAHLTPGAGVVTTRGDVHYIVTEHGVAYLHGKNVEERALALISIAHPDFRAQLLRDAIEAKYVRKELTAVQDRVSAPTQALRSSLLLDDGTLVSFREVRITDEAGIKDLAYALSRQSLYFRFMRTMKWIPQKQIQDFVFVDHRIEVAIVGTVPEAYGENIIALGGYYLDLTTNRAEVAFIVEDGWQNRGIGSHMMSSLINIAKRQGIAGFTAEVLLENKGMQSVFNNSECKTKCTLKQGVYSYQMDFT